MNATTKHAPLISEILSGSLYIGLITVSYFIHNQDKFEVIKNKENTHLFISLGIAWFIAAWIVGTFIDATRDSLIEIILDKKQRINWDFFFRAEYEKVKQLEEFYFAYYSLDVNMVLSIILLLITWGFYRFKNPFGHFSLFIFLLLLLFFIFFVWDAKVLRKDIKKFCEEVQ